MGLTIRGKYKGSPEWDIGYITFGLLRMDIAKAINKEYGEHYQSMYLHPREDWTEFNKETAILEKKYKLRTRVTDFLWESDSDGRLSPFKCKALLDVIKDVDYETLYGYVGFGKNYCMKFSDFKHLLRECYERRCYLVWS